MKKKDTGNVQDKPYIDPNSKKINVFIPIKNRDRFRILKCVNQIKKNNLGLVDKVIIIDNSDVSIKDVPGTIIERIGTSNWNKAYLLNKAIKKYPNEFIMSVDVDILLDKEHFLQISKNLTKKSFICDTNVRRLLKKDISDNYLDMIRRSYPWRSQDVNQLLNTANGGFQVYAYSFWEFINGIQEGLGLYHGAVDNVMYYRARMNNLNIIDISYPLLHLEHNKKKEDNYNESERQLALGYRSFKTQYLNYMIQNFINKNPEKISGQIPNMDLFYQFKYMLANQDKIVQKAVNEGKKEVTLGYQTLRLEKAKPSILLAVINNYGQVPDYFMYDVINLLTYTWSKGYDVHLQKVDACDVNSMRNIAVKTALGMNNDKKIFQYFMALDSDHRFQSNFLVDFVELCEKNDWQIITGLTNRKVKPYYTTQYYKLQDDLKSEDNIVNPKKSNKIIDIEASGPVGMLIRTDVFKKIRFPWFEMKYFKKKMEVVNKVNKNGKLVDEKKEKEVDAQQGGDISFCEKLKDAKIPIKLHLGYSFPHQLDNCFVNRGKVVEPSFDVQTMT